MALTFRRWMVVAILACATVAVWQIPPSDARPALGGTRLPRFVPGLGYVRRFGWPDAAARLGQANLHLRLVELRDSAFRTAAPTRGDSGLRVLMDHQIPDRIALALEGSLRQQWMSQNVGARYPVTVAVVQDTSHYNHGLPMATSVYPVSSYPFLPDAGHSDCQVLVRVRVLFQRDTRWTRNLAHDGLVSRGAARTVLSACALYATFGPPGSGIRKWLQGTDWSFAQSVDWTRKSIPWIESIQYGDTALASVTGLGSATWMLRSQLAPDAAACMAGDPPRCARALLTWPAPAVVDTTWQTHVAGVESVSLYGMMWGWNAQLGPTQGWLVSDLANALGRERFAEFWASALPPDSAYAAVTQASLGDWLVGWAQRTYGRDVAGPWIPPRARLAGIVVILLGLGVAMGFARERRVT